MLTEPMPPSIEPVGLGELKAYLRFDTPDEDAVLAGLLRSARAMCEAFTRTWLIQRTAVETIPIVRGIGWPVPTWSYADALCDYPASGRAMPPPPGARLAGAPVQGVSLVEAIDPGVTVWRTLPASAYTVNVDVDGGGRVTTMDGTAWQARATYVAGLAVDWNGVPEPLRQGIVRLTAHMWANRDGSDGAGPPAVVAALWRPWRKLRLG